MLVILLSVLFLGYTAIIGEKYFPFSKGVAALGMAAISWIVVFFMHTAKEPEFFFQVRAILQNTGEIVFFLFTLILIVEVMHVNHAFEPIKTWLNKISSSSLIAVIAIVTFFLSSILDNLATTILMFQLGAHFFPDSSLKKKLGALIVVAANAGGVFSPIGDITTTMLWLENCITTKKIILSLFFPSLLAFFFPFVWSWLQRRKTTKNSYKIATKIKGKGILVAGILLLLSIPFLHAWLHLSPLVGGSIALSILLVPYLFSKGSTKEKIATLFFSIDFSAMAVFLGTLLTIGAFQLGSILAQIPPILEPYLDNTWAMGGFFMVFSALGGAISFIAALIQSYSHLPPDHSLWILAAYSAGIGGSLTLIGSPAGLYLMGKENIGFFFYLRYIGLPTFIGAMAGLFLLA